MNVHSNIIVSISKILMVLITTYSIIIQPFIDAGGIDKVSVYDLVDLEEVPNSNESNNEEEILKEKKIDNQFTGSSLNNCIEKNKKISYYKERVNSDSNLEILIPPPDYL